MIDIHTLFVTFYSYKGGVGRTLALANMAWEAARSGHNVVVIDFDLEAPGLPAVKPFTDVIRKHIEDPKKHGGIFEAVLRYQKEKVVPSLADFYATEPIIREDFAEHGQIRIIPAGREDKEYCEALQSFNWDRFYDDEGGRDFFLQLRETIVFEFDKPDLVLIDSRTGLTDIGGICTMILPDRVVILTGLNQQNINGSRSIIETINAYSEERKKSGEIEAIDVVVVATHVPDNQEIDLTKTRLAAAAKELGREVKTTLPYTPVLSLEERVLLETYTGANGNPGIVAGYLKLYENVTEPCTKIWGVILKQINEFDKFNLVIRYKKAKEVIEWFLDLFEEEKNKEDIKKIFSHSEARHRLSTFIFELPIFLSFPGKHDQSLKLFGRIERYFRESGEKQLLAKTMGASARILSIKNEIDRALQMSEEAMAIFTNLDDKEGIAETLDDIALIYLKREDKSAAIKSLTEAKTLYQELGRSFDIYSSALRLGQLLSATGNREEGVAQLKEAEAGFTKLGDQSMLKAVQQILSQLDSG